MSVSGSGNDGLKIGGWFVAGLFVVSLCNGVGSSSNRCGAQDYKPLPPPGIEVEQSKLRDMSERIDELQRAIASAAEDSADAGRWRPDVEVMVRSVRLAVEQGLFYKPADPDRAAALLELAAQRLEAVRAGKRGLELLGYDLDAGDRSQLLVGGFVSAIDDSVQPYGLVVPAGYRPDAEHAWRLDVWLHGRGDTKTEVPFILERLSKPGQYTPADTLVLHPFGRHCNAFKFAGETDVYESLAHVESLVKVDSERVSIRGFSMGGAGCWHLAVHDPGRWLAANPGAGFVDTLVYQGWGDDPPFELDQVQQQLLRWYDVLPWVRNLSNTRVIPYSGEVDQQRQAADRVVEAAKELGLQWPYIIGPEMGHKIDPGSAATIDQTIAEWAEESPAMPRKEIDFVTYTLRYPGVDWLKVTGLSQHWEPGHVRARITGDNSLEIRTAGVTGVQLDFSRSGWPANGEHATLAIDGERFEVAFREGQAGLQCQLVRDGWRADGAWMLPSPEIDPHEGMLRKKPGLQGPIDDAFTGRFLFVVPSGTASSPAIQQWVDRELEFAQQRWKTIMRGEVRTVRDIDLTEQDIAENHLVCFGDFHSNRYLAQIAAQLPVKWMGDLLVVGSHALPAENHVPVFCYPNPKQSDRYLVVNSGMTFREFSNVSNSRQIAMLPDWAVVDVTESGRGIYPGEIVAKGFFGESWEVQDAGVR